MDLLTQAGFNLKLIKRLVSEELDRRLEAIDDTVAAGYGEFIGKRVDSNRADVKAAVLELALSPLANMARKLEVADSKTEQGVAKTQAEEEAAEAEAGFPSPV